MTDGAVLVGGRYELQGLLGRGGMAEVHRALDLRLNRLVAVKLLSSALVSDPVSQARFQRETQVAAGLNDPTIAAVFDAGEDADPSTGLPVPYLVMELVEGSTLRTILAESGPLSVERALEITTSVLDALDHSHAAGLVHRDIKPANVMVTPAGAVKVMDFGIARAVDDSGGLTKTSTVIGTAQYLSPEQAAGRRVDRRSDLYSVGCLLFELLVGRPPFVGETSVSVAYQHVREPPPAPSQLRPGLSPEVDAVVLHALAKEPDDRYASAAQMKDDVTRLLAAERGLPAAAPLAAATAPLPPVTATLPAATAPLPAAPAPLVAAPALAAPVAEVRPPARPVEERRSGTGRTVLVTLAVLMVLALGVFGLYRVFTPGSDQAAVPDVVGRSRADAEAAMARAGLVAKVTTTSAGDSAAGTVVSQKPAGGAEVARGSTVTLRVARGAAKVSSASPSATRATASSSSSADSDPSSSAPESSSSTSPDDPRTSTSPDDPTSSAPQPTRSSSSAPPSTTPKPSASASASASASEDPGPGNGKGNGKGDDGPGNGKGKGKGADDA